MENINPADTHLIEATDTLHDVWPWISRMPEDSPMGAGQFFPNTLSVAADEILAVNGIDTRANPDMVKALVKATMRMYPKRKYKKEDKKRAKYADTYNREHRQLDPKS